MMPNTGSVRELKGSGPIDWMIYNRVTPNLLMLILLIGGFFMATRIKQEVFPEFSTNMVTISVVYPGASPEEIEQGIVLSVEESVRGLEGVKEVTATASESSGVVNVELLDGVDAQRVYQDIQQEIARITTFPDDAEEPQVSLQMHRRDVVTIQLYGDVSEIVLRNLAEEMRDRLLQDARITQVDLEGARDFEIHIDVSQEQLRSYGLTLQQIASSIRNTSVEIPGGSIETGSGDLLLRMKDRREWATEFADIPIVTTASGTVLYLGDIASVTEGFEDSDREATFNGYPAIGLEIYRVGDQTPIGVSEATRQVLTQIEQDLPPGIHYEISKDRSDIYRQRLHMLLKNACIGLTLVLLVLGLFLELKLAFWVTMGIPISFLGAFLFLPGLDITINMISMFAFIVALGIVVDDAIIAGENIYEYRQRGMGFIKASIEGTKAVATPIAFSILTNIVAFLPLLFVPGVMGKIWRVIPVVVSMVFLVSWVEAVFILPSHLAHTKSHNGNRITAVVHRIQEAFSKRLSQFIQTMYGPFLQLCLRYRYMTVSISIMLLLTIIGYALSGRMGFILMPKVESDRAVVTAVLPFGTADDAVVAVRDRLEQAAQTIKSEHGGDTLVQGIYTVRQENTVRTSIYLTDPEIRPISTSEVTQIWRHEVGQITGLESIRFESDSGGPGRGSAITVELSHRDIETLDRAGSSLAASLGDFEHVKDINDGYTPGKSQLSFKLKPEGRSLGLTSSNVANQVRNAFYGATALRQQRDRNEVKVLVRLPESERSSEYDIESLLVRTPSGGDIPLYQVAEVVRGRAYTSIDRRDGRRSIKVTADVDPISETNQVLATLNTEILPQLARDYPSLSYGYEGHQAEMRDTMANIRFGFMIVMLFLYFLLAIPFRSYSQPVIVMLAIPFGIVGAVIGHKIMGYSLSIISMFGIVALAGVVVNDALVMIDYANRKRREGNTAFDSILKAGIRRFRPIMLTTLTTFGGLAPMIFETSRQARFMIPMAISLGYGIVFATSITLVIVPSLYMVIEDLRRLARKKNTDPISDVAYDKGVAG
jgi:multidrug efflux pump subunit AcrB